MTTAARKTPARKAPARKRSAAVAARAEVRGEKGKPVVLAVRFRGEDFQVPLEKIASGKTVARFEAVRNFGTAQEMCALLFGILGQVDSARWINLMSENDDLGAAAWEYIDAINKAAKDPNF